VADDFGYLEARARARTAELLPQGFFNEAMSVDFADFLRMLADTPYGSHLSGEGLVDVDRAVTAHFRERVADLPNLVYGRVREAVRLLFIRADLVNVKAILRAKVAGHPADEVRQRLVGGTLSETLLEALLEAPDLASMAQILVLPGHPLAKALREAAKHADPLEAELTLDRVAYEDIARQARRIGGALLNYFRTEIDLLNLGTAFKLRALGRTQDAESFFVPGGFYVSPTLFLRVVNGEQSALQELAQTPLAPVQDAGNLKDFERIARCLLLERARAGRFEALGAGTTLYYVRAKEWEAAKIRLLARRAYYGLPVEVIEKEVVCP
jgi:V/A-type H+-transporting ATPase subunit C